MKTNPELRPGYNFTLIGAVPTDFVGKYYRVVNMEPFIYVTGEGDDTEFTAVATGSNSGWKDVEALEPNDSQLYFVRPGVKDGCDYYLKIPSGTERWGVNEDTDVGHFDNELTPYHSPGGETGEYGFWLAKDQYPSYKADNNTGHSLTPKVWHQGIKFTFEALNGKPDTFTIIPLGGLAIS